MAMSRTVLSIVSAAAILCGMASAGDTQISALQSAERETVAAARNDVDGARDDRDDAKLYLAELERGNFAGIFAVADDGSLRCGEVEANPACAPLTAQDKAEALAEAREAISSATAQLHDAKVELVEIEGVQSADISH
jgi:hypothetical protein